MASYDPLEHASPATRQRYLNARERRKSREASFQVKVPPSAIQELEAKMQLEAQTQPEAKMQQEQSSRSEGGLHLKSTKRGLFNTKRGLLPYFFCLSLFFLAIGIIVVVLINPIALQTRLTGIQTTGLVTATGERDRCQYFTYTFVDSHSQVQQITNPSMCESGFQSVGDHVTIWYPQDHPGQMITTNDLIFDLIFLLGFSSPMILLSAFCVVSFVRGSMKQRRQRKRGDTEGSLF